MSEEVPQTADAAIRGWIVAVGFTLVLIGGELMAEKDGVRFWTGVGLAVAGLPCYLSAVWWKTLKPNLDKRFLVTLSSVATDARWWVGCLFVVLLGFIFSPIIQRLWTTPETAQNVKVQPSASDSGAVAEAQKSTLIKWLQQAQGERDRTIQELDTTQKQLALAGGQIDSSPLLKLTDAKRWRFITSFLDWPLSPNGPPHCYAWVAVKPNSASASALWAELSPLLIHSNWQVTVGWESRPFFNNGVIVLSGTGPGDPFICGTRLTELMQNQIPILISIRNNQITPTLEQCKYECVGIRVGDDVAR